MFWRWLSMVRFDKNNFFALSFIGLGRMLTPESASSSTAMNEHWPKMCCTVSALPERAKKRLYPPTPLSTPQACGVDNGVGGYNRFFARSGSADTVQHIFGQCSFIAVEEDALSGVSIRPNPMNESAKKLFLSKRTIDNHRQNILNKLGMNNTAGLVRFAVENGLLH